LKRNHFDTGGLNIKTAGMVHMKCDMAGGAAVFAMQLIADLQLPVKYLIVLVQKMLSMQKHFTK
jgi:leucyl aminopeptidase